MAKRDKQVAMLNKRSNDAVVPIRKSTRELLALAACLAVVAMVAGCGGSAKKDKETPSIALLTDVRAKPTDDGDRIVFAFRSSPSHVVASYVGRSELVEDGSGRHVDVAGSAFLVLRFESASGFDLSHPPGEKTYHGPRRFSPPGMQSIREVVRLGDFEAVLTWAIGLSAVRSYTVEHDGSDVVIQLAG